MKKHCYKCPACGKVCTRNSEKQWIKSFCEKSGRYTRIQRIFKKRQ